MNTASLPKCYGAMFPNVLRLPEDQTASGKVFSVLLQRAGGMWRSRRTITVDQGEWQACQKCPMFESCYKLSMAQLALQTAVHDQ